MTLSPWRLLLLLQAVDVIIYVTLGLSFALLAWVAMVLWFGHWMDR